jgi:hypothetical protein
MRDADAHSLPCTGHQGSVTRQLEHAASRIDAALGRLLFVEPAMPVRQVSQHPPLTLRSAR